MCERNKELEMSEKEIKMAFNDGIQLPSAAMNQILNMSDNKSDTIATVKSLLSKRITKEMLIQKSRLMKVLENYEIVPVDYSIESPDTKKSYKDTIDGPLPDKMVLHGDFILRLKEEN